MTWCGRRTREDTVVKSSIARYGWLAIIFLRFCIALFLALVPPTGGPAFPRIPDQNVRADGTHAHVLFSTEISRQCSFGAQSKSLVIYNWFGCEIHRNQFFSAHHCVSAPSTAVVPVIRDRGAFEHGRRSDADDTYQSSTFKLKRHGHSKNMYAATDVYRKQNGPSLSEREYVEKRAWTEYRKFTGKKMDTKHEYTENNRKEIKTRFLYTFSFLNCYAKNTFHITDALRSFRVRLVRQ